jgi:hypothetical protein
VQQYDRLSGSCLAIEAVALFCLQVVVCHCWTCWATPTKRLCSVGLLYCGIAAEV